MFGVVFGVVFVVDNYVRSVTVRFASSFLAVGVGGYTSMIYFVEIVYY